MRVHYSWREEERQSRLAQGESISPREALPKGRTPGKAAG